MTEDEGRGWGHIGIKTIASGGRLRSSPGLLSMCPQQEDRIR